MRTLIMGIEGKGGAGKSLSVTTMIEILRNRGSTVSVIDCDATNSSTISLYTEGRFVDLASAKAAGSLVGLFDDNNDFVVMDVGARDEAIIKKNFQYIRQAAEDAGAKIVALRPVNLNVAVHANIKDWIQNFCDGELSTAILLRSVACGRNEEAFERRWSQYEWKRRAIDSGHAREMAFSDLGAEYAENLQTVRTPLSAIVAGDFKAPEGVDEQSYLTFCDRVYDRDARLHIGIWLRENGDRLIQALGDLGVKV